MEYKLYGKFITDGDYWIDMPDDICFIWSQNFEGYSIYLNSEDVYTIRDFLEKLMVSFRVSYTHHYLVTDLYKMVESVYDSLFDDNEVFSTLSLGGNYEGTCLTLIKLQKGEENANN